MGSSRHKLGSKRLNWEELNVQLKISMNHRLENNKKVIMYAENVVFAAMLGDCFREIRRFSKKYKTPSTIVELTFKSPFTEISMKRVLSKMIRSSMSFSSRD